MFRRIVENLAKRGYQRTVPQCRAKIKSLKKKYKEIRDRMRRSGAGKKSDDEVDTPSDFPYFKEIDVVMGGRAVVKPVHIFDSSSSSLVGDDTQPLPIESGSPISPRSTASTTGEPTPVPSGTI